MIDKHANQYSSGSMSERLAAGSLTRARTCSLSMALCSRTIPTYSLPAINTESSEAAAVYWAHALARGKDSEPDYIRGEPLPVS